MDDILQIKNLCVNYGFIRALKGIDITVKKGTIVALLGANGAGKTTTLRTVSGVLKPSDGEVILDGEKISGILQNSQKGIDAIAGRQVCVFRTDGRGKFAYRRVPVKEQDYRRKESVGKASDASQLCESLRFVPPP